MKAPRSLVLMGSFGRTHRDQDMIGIRAPITHKRTAPFFVRCVASHRDTKAAFESAKPAKGEITITALPFPQPHENAHRNTARKSLKRPASIESLALLVGTLLLGGASTHGERLQRARRRRVAD